MAELGSTRGCPTARTAVLQADNVIDFAAVESICLGDQAVFAQKICAVSDCLTQFGTNPSSHLPDSGGLAPSRGASSAQFAGSDPVSDFSSSDKPSVFSLKIRSATRVLASSEGWKAITFLRAGGRNELDYFVVGFVRLHGLNLGMGFITATARLRTPL